MRRIIFYIASSLKDFEGDIEDIKRFLNGLNNILVDSGAIVSVREAAEGGPDPESIAASSHFYLLVGESLSEVARDEFEEALHDFREGGSPLVVTYFYDLADEASDESVETLKQRLRQELGHFYSY